MKHILIIDDDHKLRSLLIDYLSQHAFRASGVKDSYQLAQVLAVETVDLLVVDLNLGHEDGLEIVRTISSKADTPIIIISGDRLDETDKVVGLELGAADYMTKPFGLREFLARVRANLRARPRAPERREHRVYSFANWELNIKRRQLVRDRKDEVKLTSAEFNLLTAFLDKPKRVLSREQLLAASRVHDEEIFDRSIDVLILRLRRKIEADPSNPAMILTERGAGYVFDVGVSIDERRRSS